MIERDDNIPELRTLLAELDRARSIAAPSGGRMSPLGELQRSFKDYVLTRDLVGRAPETTLPRLFPAEGASRSMRRRLSTAPARCARQLLRIRVCRHCWEPGRSTRSRGNTSPPSVRSSHRYDGSATGLSACLAMLRRLNRG